MSKVLDGPIYWHDDRFAEGEYIPNAQQHPAYTQLVAQGKITPTVDITTLSSSEAIQIVKQAEASELDRLEEQERNHPQYAGGRKTVLEAIANRG